MDSNSEVVPQTEVVVTDMAPEENAERLVTSVETSQSVNSSIDESNVDSSSVVIEKESDQDAKVSDEIPKTTVAIVDLIVVTDTETPTSETAEMEIVETETAESETAETETAATETAAIAVVETEVENLVTTEIDASSFANHQDVPTYETSNNAIDLETEPQVNAKSQDKEVEETKYAEETESEDETESVTEEDIVENAIDLPEKSEVPSEVIESQTVLVKASANEKGTELKEKSNEFSDISTQKANEVADVRLSNDQKNFNNQIQDIISDIDINIKTQEKITKLKEQELKLIQKQNELTNQIQQQQILAQQLTAQNQFKQKQWEQQQIEKQEFLSSKINQQDGLCSTQSHLHTAYNQSDDSHNKKETTNLSKSIDLRKIFTPATDAVEILPKNHYQQYQPKPATSPNILPAYSDAGKHRVQLNIHQDQLIEKYSKPGLQVVKSPWEAALQTGSASSAFLEESKPRSLTPSSVPKTYFHSGGNDLTDAGEPVSYGIPLSNQQESFKKSLNHQQSSILPTNPQRELAYKPSVAQGWGGRNVELPREYFDFNEPLSSWEENNNEQCNNQYISEEHDILRENVQMGHGQNQSLDFEVNVQTRLHQLEQFQKYFLEQQRLEIEILKRRDDSRLFRLTKLYHEQFKHESPNEERLHNEDVLQTGRSTDEEINENVNVQDLIYSFEQQSLREHTESARPRNQNCSTYLSSEATKADNETGGLYVPKEISLASYAPPPKNFTDQQPAYSGHNISSINTTYESHRPLPTASIANETSVGTSWGFPVSKPIASGFSTIPPKQQLSAPASYQKIPQTSALGAPQVNFNPSPLSYEKLSKFEQPNLSYPNQNYLNVRQTSQVRNASPTPFAFGSNEARFSGSHASRSPSSIASISPQPLRSPCISTRYGQPSNNAVPRLTSSSQAQTFNNCARGWGTEPESQYIYPGPNVLPAPGNMPYSDF
ncbi:myb-like protein P isoform X6 [Drosophila obscura]|uniref:myb-like protein P isoform X6 n=1 Tax=Drosophila obscura TaxID=7282 RepID=UPI001BB2AE94|nr:myb-like protein P isoform X6 [Drosophila obscura]